MVVIRPGKQRTTRSKLKYAVQMYDVNKAIKVVARMIERFNQIGVSARTPVGLKRRNLFHSSQKSVGDWDEDRIHDNKAVPNVFIR